MFSETESLLPDLQVFISAVDFVLLLPLCFSGGGGGAFHRLCAQVMKHPCLSFLAKAITLASDVNRRRVMQQAIQHGSGEDVILECVIMPFSLIVLLVEAILGAVSHLLLLNIPSRACLWLAGIQ